MTLQQFLLILRARYKVVLIAFFSTVISIVALSLILPKQYTATASIVVDVKSPDAMSGQVLQGLIAPGYMATQIDIINSDRTAKIVAKLLHMDENTAFREQWMEETKGEGLIIDWLADLLQKKLDIKPSRESNVISINYTGKDPDFSASVANAFAKAYIDINLELRLEPARQYAKFFDAQTKAARENLEKAQQALSNYRQQHGITSADQQLDFETTKLNDTSGLLTGVQGQTTDSQSKRQNTKKDTVPEVMQSALINGMKADIAKLEATITLNNVTLGKNHPTTQSTEAQLSALRAQLEAETKKITASIDTTYQIGKQREQELQNALSAQKVRVLMLNKQRDELNVLQRDIESAQRTFEAVSSRASQTNIESQANQTNISILNFATPPRKASKPRVLINTLVSIILGSILGVGLALILELLNRRIRSYEDISEVLNIPMLGSIASANGMFKIATEKGIRV